MCLPNIHGIFFLSFLFAYEKLDGAVPHLRISREHGRITSPATSPVSPTSLAPAICWWLQGRENNARKFWSNTDQSFYDMPCYAMICPNKRRICMELVFPVDTRDSLRRSCVSLLVRTYVGSLFFCFSEANVDRPCFYGFCIAKRRE